ncbi:MAG: HTH domain-containing protein [Flavobacteriaceae bacterium]|nr:HTH domain-containing protein [Flavobacteriaceae bacterium]
MKTLKQLERLRKAHKLIQQEKTGSPSEFANKLDVSERQVYKIIDYLKEIDAPIIYNRKIKTYYYTTSFDLLVNVSVQVLIENEVRNIYAGTTFLNENFLTARLVQCTNLY